MSQRLKTGFQNFLIHAHYHKPKILSMGKMCRNSFTLIICNIHKTAIRSVDKKCIKKACFK